MNNEGFTLVELLAVITLLALLALATFEALDVVNKGNKEKAQEIQVDQILTAAISYVPTSSIKLPNVIPGTSGCSTITYQASSDSPSATNICEVRISLNYLYTEGVLEETISDLLEGQNLNMQDSYISIVYVTTATKSNYEEATGKYDGRYFYQLVEVLE